MNICDKPLAAAGFINYRCKSLYGWIMVAATDDADALNEARRSSDAVKAEDLEVWNGVEYVPV